MIPFKNLLKKMNKTFRDLKEGDIVWVIEGNKIIEEKVEEVYESIFNRFIVKLHYYKYYGYPGSKGSGNMFVNEEDAIKQLGELLIKRKQTLEKKIDSLVSKFDALDSISIPPTVKPSTIIPSMKELKLGDSVWFVDKINGKVRKTKILEIKKNATSWNYINCLEIKTPIYSFITYPNASRSTRLSYYTTEEQAWRYMLEWRKSRIKTVGNEMEKLMKELEEIERNEKIWRSTKGR